MNETPYMKIKDAVRVTGLSAYYLRNGIKDGSVPHTRTGKGTYYINVAALLRQQNADNRAGAGENVR